MDKLLNPFAPGAGSPPPELSGRGELLARADMALRRVQRGRAEKSLILVGLRGVGKTVLLNEIQQSAKRLKYQTAVVEAHDGKTLPALLIPQLRRVLLKLDRMEALNKQVKFAWSVLKSFMNGIRMKYGDIELALDVDAEDGAADSGDLELDLPELMAAVGNAAAARRSALALFIDEIQYFTTPELSALIMAMHRVAQDRLPIIMFAAGLPQIIALFGNSKSYAERLFDFPEIGALTEQDTAEALEKPAQAEGVRFRKTALDEIFQQSRGYPFFLQEWGYHVWNVARGSPVTEADARAATAIAIQRLDRGFFRVRFDRLTPREKSYLRIMAELGEGPHRSGEVARRLGKKSSDLGPLREGLIGKGMIYAPAHGDIAFTVPLFDQFMKRIMPPPELA